VQLKGTS